MAQKVDALFVAADKNVNKEDGKLEIKEARPMIQKIAAELLGVEDGEGSDDFLKDMFEELDAK